MVQAHRHPHTSYADTEGYYVRTKATHDRTRITSGISPVDRVRTQTTTYDDFGMPATVEDDDDAVSGRRDIHPQLAGGRLPTSLSKTRTTRSKRYGRRPASDAEHASGLSAGGTADVRPMRHTSHFRRRAG